MIDNYRHKGLRKKLVEELKGKGITDPKVLDAIGTLPRHWFFDNAFIDFAYQDKAFPIGSGQTISQPFTVAMQSQLLEIQPGDKILEIGTGSAYQACILVALGAKVFSIERQKNLHTKAQQLMRALNYRAKLFYGDGFKGLPTFAPFDKVIITAAAPTIPKALLDQLRVGGMMVIPVESGGFQTMKRLIKLDESNAYDEKEFGKYQFVPMLKDKARD